MDGLAWELFDDGNLKLESPNSAGRCNFKIDPGAELANEKPSHGWQPSGSFRLATIGSYHFPKRVSRQKVLVGRACPIFCSITLSQLPRLGVYICIFIRLYDC